MTQHDPLRWNFLWYHVEPNGAASVHDDTPAVRARVDAGESGWYGSAEGPILHGNVLATAFCRRVEVLYDTPHWVKTGELRHAGMSIKTTITALPRELSPGELEAYDAFD